MGGWHIRVHPKPCMWQACHMHMDPWACKLALGQGGGSEICMGSLDSDSSPRGRTTVDTNMKLVGMAWTMHQQVKTWLTCGKVGIHM